MSSKVKQDGELGRLLNRMADRGGGLLTDYPGFPPSKIMNRPKKAGLVELQRQGTGGKGRRSIWYLTEKGWAAIERSKPEDVE